MILDYTGHSKKKNWERPEKAFYQIHVHDSYDLAKGKLKNWFSLHMERCDLRWARRWQPIFDQSAK